MRNFKLEQFVFSVQRTSNHLYQETFLHAMNFVTLTSGFLPTSLRYALLFYLALLPSRSFRETAFIDSKYHHDFSICMFFGLPVFKCIPFSDDFIDVPSQLFQYLR